MVSTIDEWEGENDGKTVKLTRPGYEPLSNEHLAVDIEEAVRLNASVLAVQVFIGSQHERQSLQNLTNLIDAASRYGIAVMGVVAVGRAMERTAKYFRMATRIMAELGCHMVKCYHILVPRMKTPPMVDAHQGLLKKLMCLHPHFFTDLLP